MPSRLLKKIAWATLRVRLTVWNTLVVLLIALMALLAVKVGARAALYREADAVLRGEVNEVAIALKDLYPNTDAVVDDLRRKAAGHEERGWFTQLLTDDGKTIWKSDSCPQAVATWPVASGPGVTLDAAGLPTHDEVIARYGDRSGRPLDELAWYRVLACYRLGLILEGTHARACAGMAPKEIGDQLHATTVSLLTQALALID